MSTRPGGPVATVITHREPAQTAHALTELIEAAQRAGWRLRFDAQETDKLALPDHPAVLADAPLEHDVDLCLVLGGDGTILRALSLHARSGVPVFAINFGEIGFLATVEPENLRAGLERAFAGSFDLLTLPAVELITPDGEALAINDVSIHRRVGARVAELAFALQGETLGRVRCDGLVVATPAGSTGYNLANGGPVMAWGVEGYVVSFIAPHSLTARALVVAPDDEMVIENRSGDPLDVSVDGRPTFELGPHASTRVRFVHGAGAIAQIPGTSFYERLQQKFGRLTS